LGEIFISPGGVGAKKFSAKKKSGHQLNGKKKAWTSDTVQQRCFDVCAVISAQLLH